MRGELQILLHTFQRYFVLEFLKLLGMLTISAIRSTHGDAHTLSGNRSDKEDHRICARIDTLSGSSFFDAGRQVTPTLRSFDKPSDMRLRSVKGESDVSRLQSLKSIFFVTLVPFFVSIMFVLRKQGGACMEERGQAWESGYAWKSLVLCDERWIRLGGWMEEAHCCFLTYTPVISIS